MALERLIKGRPLLKRLQRQELPSPGREVYDDITEIRYFPLESKLEILRGMRMIAVIEDVMGLRSYPEVKVLPVKILDSDRNRLILLFEAPVRVEYSEYVKTAWIYP